MVVPSPFLFSAFVNWMAHKLTSPFVLQRLNAEVDTLRLGLFILLGMTGAVGYHHLEDLLQLLKAAKLILVHHLPPVPSKLANFLREETKEWKGAQEDFQHARGGLTQLALYADPTLSASVPPSRSWSTGNTPREITGQRHSPPPPTPSKTSSPSTRPYTRYRSGRTPTAPRFKRSAVRGRPHELKPSPTWTLATLSVTSDCHARIKKTTQCRTHMSST